ncbi:hypothetical protein D9M68_838550 [compost metagenome]
MQGAISGDRVVHQALHRAGVAHVGIKRDDLAALRLDGLQQRGRFGVLPKVVDHHASAGLREQQRGRPADAGGGAGDQRGLALQRH